MIFNDGEGCSQPQTIAEFFGGEIWIKDFSQIFLIDTYSLINKGKFDIIAFRQGDVPGQD